MPFQLIQLIMSIVLTFVPWVVFTRMRLKQVVTCSQLKSLDKKMKDMFQVFYLGAAVKCYKHNPNYYFFCAGEKNSSHCFTSREVKTSKSIVEHYWQTSTSFHGLQPTSSEVWGVDSPSRQQMRLHSVHLMKRTAVYIHVGLLRAFDVFILLYGIILKFYQISKSDLSSVHKQQELAYQNNEWEYRWVIFCISGLSVISISKSETSEAYQCVLLLL